MARYFVFLLAAAVLMASCVVCDEPEDTPMETTPDSSETTPEPPMETTPDSSETTPEPPMETTPEPDMPEPSGPKKMIDGLEVTMITATGAQVWYHTMNNAIPMGAMITMEVNLRRKATPAEQKSNNKNLSMDKKYFWTNYTVPFTSPVMLGGKKMPLLPNTEYSVSVLPHIGKRPHSRGIPDDFEHSPVKKFKTLVPGADAGEMPMEPQSDLRKLIEDLEVTMITATGAQAWFRTNTDVIPADAEITAEVNLRRKATPAEKNAKMPNKNLCPDRKYLWANYTVPFNSPVMLGGKKMPLIPNTEYSVSILAHIGKQPSRGIPTAFEPSPVKKFTTLKK